MKLWSKSQISCIYIIVLILVRVPDTKQWICGDQEALETQISSAPPWGSGWGYEQRQPKLV
jgi:hypothetical protein